MGFDIWTADDRAAQPRPDELDEARRQLRAANLVSDNQQATCDRILSFCDEHPDALYRRCLAGHLTGSGLVVDPGRDRSLLIHHVKLDRWLQPGGHADGDGNLGAVALAEAGEETGLTDLRLVTPAIDVDIHSIPARGDEPEHLHLDLRYLILVGANVSPAPNHETKGARWVTATDEEIDGELRRAVVRALQIAGELLPR